MKRVYICKYCGRRTTLFSYDHTANLVSLIDHIVIKHQENIPEIGGIYLSDIPKECFIIEEGDNCGSGSPKTEAILKNLYSDISKRQD